MQSLALQGKKAREQPTVLPIFFSNLSNNFKYQLVNGNSMKTETTT